MCVLTTDVCESAGYTIFIYCMFDLMQIDGVCPSFVKSFRDYRLQITVYRQTIELTKNRDDDDDEVKDVPRLLEEVQSKTDELQDTLGGENDDEDRVDDVQSILEFLRLLVVFETHQYHVEHNHDHDENVELLVCHDVEEETLYQQLCCKPLTTNTLIINNL